MSTSVMCRNWKYRRTTTMRSVIGIKIFIRSRICPKSLLVPDVHRIALASLDGHRPGLAADRRLDHAVEILDLHPVASECVAPRNDVDVRVFERALEECAARSLDAAHDPLELRARL